MAIFLKKNDRQDPWFGLHGRYIPVGEVLKLIDIDKYGSSSKYPAIITVGRSKTTGDKHQYLMSLSSLDYLRSTGVNHDN